MAEGDDLFALTDGGLAQGTFIAAGQTIEGIGEDLITAALRTDYGMSGCGLYDREGRYIGMLIGGTEDGRAAAVPADRILALCRAVTIKE